MPGPVCSAPPAGSWRPIPTQSGPLAEEPRRRLNAAIGRRVLQRMEWMMASLPEDSPPRLAMSVLPRLREQNDQIIAMSRA